MVNSVSERHNTLRATFQLLSTKTKVLKTWFNLVKLERINTESYDKILHKTTWEKKSFISFWYLQRSKGRSIYKQLSKQNLVTPIITNGYIEMVGFLLQCQGEYSLPELTPILIHQKSESRNLLLKKIKPFKRPVLLRYYRHAI